MHRLSSLPEKINSFNAPATILFWVSHACSSKSHMLSGSHPSWAAISYNKRGRIKSMNKHSNEIASFLRLSNKRFANSKLNFTDGKLKKDEKQEKEEQLLTCNRRGWCFWIVLVFPSNFFPSPDPVSMGPFSAVSLFSSAYMTDKYIRKNI